MQYSKELNPMPMAPRPEDNPLWAEYRRQILQTMKEQGFSTEVIEARIEIAYNRMHGFPNSPELLRKADGEQASQAEWATGTTGKEFF